MPPARTLLRLRIVASGLRQETASPLPAHAAWCHLENAAGVMPALLSDEESHRDHELRRNAGFRT
jgi:hypothetical protein